ncbi:MAG: 50S ribosomal protein L28 [Bacteroidetes bacterium RIFCSPLOWO2_12_FULL_37_12]|nr:MAG: 50S ribosomal protein L28 [Bacteroidetes bacterium RIFCSPLOWO2_12_FULL_37_12]
MAQKCQITGKTPLNGHRVSHANNKTLRKFYPNLQDKRFFIQEENRWVKLRVSVNGLKTIRKIGISEALKRAKEKGFVK